MEEASEIALFLGTTVSEVLNHAGVAVDLGGQSTRILLASYIDEKGGLHNLQEPRPLPQSVIDRASIAGKGCEGVLITATPVLAIIP